VRAIRPVILCGGAGTRLAPLSRPDRPKPLLPLGPGGTTLLSDTLRRFRGGSDPLLICGIAHADAMRTEAPGVEALVEPAPRGTAPAALAAAMVADPDDVLLIAPADHAVRDEDALRAAILGAAPAAADHLVTFGIRATRPDTGFGWIEPGSPSEGVLAVRRFVEKPDAALAERYLAAGWLWNSGMVLVRAGFLLDEARRLAPDLVGPVAAAVAARRGGLLGPTFADAPAGSLDVRIAERTDRAAVAPVDCGWTDLGTWDAVRAHHGDAWVDALLRR
jgi:mannose-1-phosphate guanylyltransferase